MAKPRLAMHRTGPRWQRLHPWASWACLLAAAGLFWLAHHNHLYRPTTATPDSGWWAFWDQGHYLSAAQALARLDFAAAGQSYEPGYPALAAPFTLLPGGDPFFIPDLAALLAACWLFGGIGVRLLEGWPGARAASMALFVLATVGDPRSADTWVDPWTTTPVAPLLLGAALATIVALERLRPAPVFLAAFASCAVAAFRPGDVPIAAVPCALGLAWAVIRQRPGAGGVGRVLAAGVGGAACAIVPAVALHAAVWGLAPSPYMLLSRDIGFNPLLLPLRWVLVVIGPQPLTDGRGLAAAFPWIVPGVAGGLACLLAPPKQGRAAPAVLLGMAGLSLALFLSYRDLHPVAIWRYQALHYFKWLLPVAALTSLVLVRRLVFGPRRLMVGLVSAALAVALFDWRPALRTSAPPDRPLAAARRDLVLPQGLPTIQDAVLVAAQGAWGDIYEQAYAGWTAARTYLNNQDFKAYPRPGGFLLVPLRPIGPGVRFQFPDGVVLDRSIPPLAVRQGLRFRPPCWLAGCTAAQEAAAWPWDQAPFALPAGIPIPLDAAAAPLLLSGWSEPGATGDRWTLGQRSALVVQVTPPPAAGATLVLDATAFIPAGSGAMDVAVQAAGQVVGRWPIADADPHRLRMALPASAFGPDGLVRLVIAVANPRRPADWLPPYDDKRSLGLHVRSMTFVPAG